ncbi:MAG: lysostaphin resistance A-like protein [Chitinophagaceae bacterium]
MVGIIVELIISWLLLWFICKKHLLVLGFIPTKTRFGNFLFGFLTAAICCTIYFLSFTAFANSRWTLNKEISNKILAESSWWTLRSVLYEELIFRGALLYIAIQKFGTKTACLISAVSFGVYHWFSMGALGNPMQMVFLFFMTGIWGFMFAMAFAKTKSLYLPIGLHFGWNLVSTVVFSQGSLGNQLLIHKYGQQLSGLLSIAVFLFQVFSVPFFTYWYLKGHSFNKKQLHGDKEQQSLT